MGSNRQVVSSHSKTAAKLLETATKLLEEASALMEKDKEEKLSNTKRKERLDPESDDESSALEEFRRQHKRARSAFNEATSSSYTHIPTLRSMMHNHPLARDPFLPLSASENEYDPDMTLGAPTGYGDRYRIGQHPVIVDLTESDDDSPITSTSISHAPATITSNVATTSSSHPANYPLDYSMPSTSKFEIPAENINEDGSEDYRALVALEEKALVSNTEKFDCPICYVTVRIGRGVVLKNCLHSFCKQCLKSSVEHAQNPVVQCPFINEEYSCESYLEEREIRALVTRKMLEKHLQKSLSLAESQAQDSFHCKTPDCSGWCLCENGVSAFPCPVCRKTNCLRCDAVHEGRNCKQYQEYLDFTLDTNTDGDSKKTKEYLQGKLKRGEAMHCPKCQVIVVKVSGCDHMKCLMCKSNFTWKGKQPGASQFLEMFRIPPLHPDALNFLRFNL